MQSRIEALARADPNIRMLVDRCDAFPVLRARVLELYDSHVALRCSTLCALHVAEAIVMASPKSLLRPVRNPDPAVDADFEALMRRHEAWRGDTKLRADVCNLVADDVVHQTMRSLYHRIPASRTITHLVANVIESSDQGTKIVYPHSKPTT